MKKHLRSEKNCLNCGAYVEEQYCSQCGQENVETRESFGHLVSHLFSDLTHYDSKLFTTLKDLLFKPGSLTREWLAGRRANYLHPVRMYVFVSFLYFLVTLSLDSSEHRAELEIAATAKTELRQELTDSLRLMLSSQPNKSVRDNIKDSVVKHIISAVKKDSVNLKTATVLFNITYQDLVAFDSAQKSLPEQKRQKGIKPWLYHHWLNTYRLYGKKGAILLAGGRTLHFVPKMMFILLPLFALLLKLFYNRKKYLYVDHVIFSIHFHTAVFLIFLVVTVVSLIFPALSRDAQNFETLLAIIYLGMALSRTYGQSGFVTIMKTIGLSVLYSFFILLGYVVLALTALL